MWKRLIAVSMLAFALVACQESKPNNQSLVTGVGNVTVSELRIISTGESSALLSGGSVSYLVTKVELTNDTSQPLYPTVGRFTLRDQTGGKIVATDNGSATFAGISNDTSPMKPGDKRTFVIGFRAQPTTSGTIAYEY
ncbi:MAG: hypothetical protein NVS2B17_20780 [Candidatus Velthaea sp.]